ncbi:MAG: ribosome maturation factor RimM [Acidimicrobiia bacterium]
MTGRDRIAIGYVRRAHGLRGEVIIRPLSDDPKRFAVGSRFVTDEDSGRSLVVQSTRSHADGVLVGFGGVSDRTAAEHLQGVTLTIDASERRELGEGEYWPEDLTGLIAVTPDGTHLGTVTGVVLTDAQDRLVVATSEGGAVEVPFVEPLVGDVHPSLGHIVVDPPQGLF